MKSINPKPRLVQRTLDQYGFPIATYTPRPIPQKRMKQTKLPFPVKKKSRKKINGQTRSVEATH